MKVNSTKRKRILCFFGTRPEAIKMAPVVVELRKDARFDVHVAVSAQHRGMLDQVLRLFKIKPHVDLDLMRDGQSLFDVTTRVLKGFDPVLDRLKPDLVLVHGDTTTTMGGALASFYKKIPVGHVEAGLRTRDKYRPFPEEINRRITDAIATLHFAPTKEAAGHLFKESVSPATVFVTGNTVIDALLATSRAAGPVRSPDLKKALRAAGDNPFVLMTAHRRENFGDPFKSICRAVSDLSMKFPALHWIYPVHPNPNVIGPARKYLGRKTNIHIIPPLDYADLVAAMKRAMFVVTDSGGLQEEAPTLGKPVVVLREVTERPEAVRAGAVCLVGSSRVKCVAVVSELMQRGKMYRAMATAVNPYGDGRAAGRIAQAIRFYFGHSRKRPSPFRRII